MTQAFFGGVVIGALVMACAFVLFLNRASRRLKRREVSEWEEDFFEPVPPPVATRIINRHREFTL